MNTLAPLIERFGSRSKLAKALRITPQAVYQWTDIPPRRALEIEKILQTPGVPASTDAPPILASGTSPDA